MFRLDCDGNSYTNSYTPPLSHSYLIHTPIDGFSAEKIRAYYLTNGLESGDRYFKLLLSENDSETLKSLIKGREATGETSIRINQNFELFSEWIKKSPELVPVICKGLSKLMIVDIALDREHDNPQLIFESMNSTGKALSQADLIRNFILMGVWPLIGALFMTIMFFKVIPDLDTVTRWVSFGSIAAGFIPMFYYWSKGHIYFKLPTKEERLAVMHEIEGNL